MKAETVVQVAGWQAGLLYNIVEPVFSGVGQGNHLALCNRAWMANFVWRNKQSVMR